MKLGWLLGILSAALAHLVILLFGGIFFLEKEKDAGSVQPVDLLSEVEDEEKKDEPDPDEPKEEAQDEMEAEAEEPPDAAEILRSLESPLVNDAPALEAASLADIEAALGGQGGAGDFTESLGFHSGGRIGSTGTVGLSEEKLAEAFSLAELDQAPQAILQGSPVYPSQMQGKKVEGVVTVIFVVDPAGKVENPRVESSSHEAFESPAVNAVRKWKFEPGLRAGQRVPSKMRISIRFPPR